MIKMDHWILYGKSVNPSYDICKAWLKNNGIPYENRSVYSITKEEIIKLAKLLPEGVKGLVYPDPFSFALINPQRAVDQVYIEEIHSGNLSEDEIISRLVECPYLVISPTLTNFNQIIIGYQYDTMEKIFRFFKVKDVTIA
jgi:arsenate reductase-like glutaredoxin family protein